MEANLNTAQLQVREIALPIQKEIGGESSLPNAAPAIERLSPLVRATEGVRRDNYLEEIAWFLVAFSTAVLLVLSLFD